MALVIPHLDLPHVSLRGDQRRAGVDAVYRFVGRHAAGVPGEVAPTLKIRVRPRDSDLPGLLADVPGIRADVPAESRLAHVDADRVLLVLRPQVLDSQ